MHLASLEVAGSGGDGRRRGRPPARARAGGLRRAAHRACATTSTRTASTTWCWGCRAASTRRWWRSWRPTRSARSASPACPCRRPTRARARGRTPRAIAANLGVDFREIPIADAMERLHGDAGGVVRGPRAGHRRGERPGAHPRQPGDGALQQVRLARAGHRQQVRAVGRLRDPLRRHGGRLRRAQGRLQGLGLPAGALAQRAARPRARAGQRARAAAVRRAARGPARRRLAARRTTCSTRSSRATSRRTSTPWSWCAAACPARRWSA